MTEKGITTFRTGKQVRLPSTEPDHWTTFIRLAADEERLEDLPHPPRSAEGYRARAREQAAAKSHGDCFQLAVETADTGETAGTADTHHADPRAGRFDHGITIGTDHRHKGHASQAVVLLLRFTFAEQRHHKCQAQIFAHNEASPALHRRLAFVEEGRLRDHLLFPGRHHDLVMRAGPLAREFTQPHTMSRP